MSKATAVVLSKEPVFNSWTNWDTLNHVSQFDNLQGLHCERLRALQKVTTEFCAFVDSDDQLPENTGLQIDEITSLMQDSQSNLTYTDWIETTGATQVVKRPGAYSWAKHVTSVTWMHQLVVVRTETAQAFAKVMPQGIYWTEFMLYAQLAKTNPIYYPHVAYLWDRKNSGLHLHPDITQAQMNSVHWYLSKGLK